MENNDDMGRTQNNFRDTRLSQGKEPYKTTKSFYLPSLNQRTNRNNMALMNNLDIDSTLLKKELSLYKSEMHKKKNELLKLKIKYGKLYEENIANKNLISNILSIPLDKVISREAGKSKKRKRGARQRKIRKREKGKRKNRKRETRKRKNRKRKARNRKIRKREKGKRKNRKRKAR